MGNGDKMIIDKTGLITKNGMVKSVDGYVLVDYDGFDFINMIPVEEYNCFVYGHSIKCDDFGKKYPGGVQVVKNLKDALEMAYDFEDAIVYKVRASVLVAEGVNNWGYPIWIAKEIIRHEKVILD